MTRSRPHFEAAAWLAAHGYGAIAKGPIKPQGIPMSSDVRFAFLDRIDAVAKPRLFQSLTALARWIEGQRGTHGLHLVNVCDLRIEWLNARGRDHEPGAAGKKDAGVQVFTLMPDGTVDRSLGYAWLDGADRERLEFTLRAVRRPHDLEAVA